MVRAEGIRVVNGDPVWSGAAHGGSGRLDWNLSLLQPDHLLGAQIHSLKARPAIQIRYWDQRATWETLGPLFLVHQNVL